MFLSLFMPTYKNKTLLLSQEVVIFSLENSLLFASKLAVSNKKIVLKKVIVSDLPTTQDAIIELLQTTQSQLKGADQTICIHSSEEILFKEIELPFKNRDQISLVLEEEMEAQLPFSPHDGNTGFIVNTTNEEGISSVLTATIKKHSADLFYTPFDAANINPDAITTDAESLAAFISSISPSPENRVGGARIIIDIQARHSLLVFCENQKIHTVKTITQGYQSFVNKAQAEKTTEPEESENKKFAEHFDSEKYQTLIEKILFACDAIALKYMLQNNENRSLFFMQSYPSYDLKKNLSSKGYAIEVFSPELVTTSTLFDKQLQAAEHWNSLSKHLGTALLLQNEEKIMLPVAITEHSALQKVKKNIATALVLLTLVSSCLFLLGYQQISALNTVLEAAEKSQLSKLNEKFSPQIATLKKPTLKRAINTIEDHVREQQVFWNMFGAKNLNALEIIYELTELIDRRVFNIDVTKINLSLSEEDHTPRVTLEGTFTSKTEAHYSDFGIFEKHLALSKRLMLTKETENSFADNAHGVKFIARFKLRDT